MNLKEARQSKNLLQADVARMINATIPAISLYESGSMEIALEDALILETNLGKIDWQEDYSPLRKHQLVQSLIELYQRYPIRMVTSFANRVLSKTKVGDKIIDHYAEIAMGSSGVAPLLPTDLSNIGLKQTRK